MDIKKYKRQKKSDSFESLNYLPNDKFFDKSKFKPFADNNSNVVNMIVSVFGRVEKTFWKKEKMLATSIFVFFHNVSNSKGFFLSFV